MIPRGTAIEFLKSLDLKLNKVETNIHPNIKNKIVNFAKKYSDRLDPGHNFYHIVLTHNLAFKLLEQIYTNNRLNKVELKQLTDLLFTSCLLHDCASINYPPSNKKMHYKQCSKLAYKKLKKWHFSDSFSKSVKHIISTHSTQGFKDTFYKIKDVGQFSKITIQLASKILFDTDRLQTIGLLGIIRELASNTIAQTSSIETILIRNKKQILKLKLKESIKFIKFMGSIESISKGDLNTKFDKLKYRLELI